MGTRVKANPIYLDHAATGWPKEPQVYAAVERQLRDTGVAAGRGEYARAALSSEMLQRCRLSASQLFAAPASGLWLLLTSGTHALNQAIQGLLRPGDHAVTTAADHNSVLRPLHALSQRGVIDYDVVPVDRQGRVAVQAIAERLRPETRLLAVSHGSNVTGAVQPLAEIAELHERHQAAHGRLRFLVDAAQTAGIWPCSLGQLPIDLWAAPGHKYLGGPLGTGLLYVAADLAEELIPLMPGGTGLHSESLELTPGRPESFEAGNPNVPALAGLATALQRRCDHPNPDAHRVAAERTRQFAEAMAAIEGLRLFTAGELPIVSLQHPELPPSELAAILDAEFGIEVRSGLHCAPLIHAAIGSAPEGTLRISFAPETPASHLEACSQALREICHHGQTAS